MGTTDTPDKEAIDRAKSVLRLKARAARRAVQPEARHDAAYHLAEHVLQLPELSGATAVLMYGGTPEEADPGVLEWALRHRGVRIAYPRVAGYRSLSLHWVEAPDDLIEGAFGILEPKPVTPQAAIEDVDAIIVPGVAFDPEGNRLGFGGGYYDALLAGEGMPPTIALAYDEQVVEQVPHDARDRKVDIVVTPTRVFRCSTTRP